MKIPVVALMILGLAALILESQATQAQLGGPAAPTTVKQTAPLDLTGYWVSVITEDWRWRMMTPPKGDYWSLPLTAEGRKVADSWDPDRDRTSGNECRAYGAAGVMRLPVRLHITWENDNTLRIDTDAGRQTRLLHFSGSVPPDTQPSWQGYSVAKWETEIEVPDTRNLVQLDRGIGGIVVGDARRGKGANLKIVTTHLRPGYLRKNGVPYGEGTVLTEYIDRIQAYGADWLILTSIVNEPKYFNQPYITSSNFKREPDGSKWNPTPCESSYGPVR
jgi:hypothetical protein